MRDLDKNIDKGISFPFRFGSSGGVVKSKLTHSDFSRIRESLHQIILTFVKERRMRTEFGSTVNQYIFEITGDETSMAMMSHEMKKAIDKHEPRVIVNSVKVTTLDEDEALVQIELDIHIIKFVKDVNMTLEVNLPAELIGGI